MIFWISFLIFGSALNAALFASDPSNSEFQLFAAVGGSLTVIVLAIMNVSKK